MTAMDGSLDALAFLYITFAHVTDGALSGEEMRSLAERVHRWRPDAPLPELGAALKSAVTRYRSFATAGERMAEAGRSAAGIAAVASPDDRARLLADLREIAGADGRISAEESAFIDALAAKLG